MQKLILGTLTMCSVINCLQADLVYASLSGLPTSFLPPLPSSSGNMLHGMRPPHLQDGHLVRPQRSLYGPPIQGWNGPAVQSQSFGVGHISKQELITLLEAAKEVANSGSQPEPAPEPEAEPEAEAGPQPTPQAAGPPAGVPLTVSLPAFVPIQLSAMYTAPQLAGAPAAGGAAAPGPAPEEEGGEGEDEEEEEGEDEEEEEEEEEPESEPEPVPGPIRPFHPIYHPWSSRGVIPYAERSANRSQVRSRTPPTRSKSKSRKSKARKSKSKKSRSKKRTPRKQVGSKKPNLRYASSAQSIHVLPPPPFLARPPAPLQLVPSNQLLSNWK